MTRPDVEMIFIDPVGIGRVIGSRHVQFNISMRNERLLKVHSAISSDPLSRVPLDTHHFAPYFRPAPVAADDQIECRSLIVLVGVLTLHRLVTCLFSWFRRV